jgi:radical SAM-linked protein
VAQFVCRYRKTGEVRWISHLDLKRTLERAMRRAELPLELTHGYNPRPKLSFGPPLPLGATGEAEMFAVHLAQATAPDELKRRLDEQLPAGLDIVEAWALPAHRKKETFGSVDVAEYRIALSDGNADDLRARVEKLLAAEELIVHRGGNRPERDVNVREHILGLEICRGDEGEVEIRARLRTGSHGGARPQEIITLLGVDEEKTPVRYHRTGLYVAGESPARQTGGVWRRWSRTRSTGRSQAP